METSFPIAVPPQWQALIPERLVGTVLVVGAENTGKSTLVRWLVEKLCRRHARVGWLDGDPGQSTLGLPTTINLALVSSPPVLLPRPDASFFIGATSPRGHMLPTLVGLRRLQEQALAATTAVVIDTTGLVDRASGGGALKQWQVELLRPQTVVALQHGRELEHLLGPWRRDGRMTVQVLPIAKAVRPRSRAERLERRRLLFRHAFENAGVVLFDKGALPLYNLEAATPGSLLALLDREGLTLALGVLRGASDTALKVITAYPHPARVAALRFGAMRLDPATGDELS
jgi:polynucleotide 5'-hydroxyl-kinase GRC3/NOL9